MLVLTRKPGERIAITDDRGNVTLVTLVEIGGGKARIGITAPSDTAIHRESVYVQIYGREPVAGKREAEVIEFTGRTPHPAVQMSPMPYLIDIIHGDPVGRHD